MSKNCDVFTIMHTAKLDEDQKQHIGTNMFLIVQHNAGGNEIWAGFAVTSPGHHAVNVLIFKSTAY